MQTRVSRKAPRSSRSLAAGHPRLAWKAQVRLCGRWRRLAARGKSNVVVTTPIGREIPGFIWAVARQLEHQDDRLIANEAVRSNSGGEGAHRRRRGTVRESSRPVMSWPKWTRLERGRPRQKPPAGAGQERNPQSGRFWTYVRDDRPFGGLDPPAAVVFYSCDRGGEHPEQHLASYGRIDAGRPQNIVGFEHIGHFIGIDEITCSLTVAWAVLGLWGSIAMRTKGHREISAGRQEGDPA